MSTFLSLVESRCSVRKYLPDPIPNDLLLRCIEAARLAPSASNSQPWRFIVVNEPELLGKVAESCNSILIRFNKFVFQAPMIVALVLEADKKIPRLARAVANKEWRLIDVGIAAEHFCLQAHELGLGTCMVGWFSEKRVKELLHIPSSKHVALLITLGFKDSEERTKEKKRKSVDDILSFNAYPH